MVETTIAVFADHLQAEAAIRKLSSAGFAMKQLSIVGRGYHTEEQVVGFYTTADRVKFWGTRGAFWGGFWGLFMGGLFITTPVIGPVVVLGFIASVVISTIEGAVTVGAVSALAAALFSLGTPKDSVIDYESALKADSFLVMAHGTAEEMDHAREILGTSGPARVDSFTGSTAAGTVKTPVHA